MKRKQPEREIQNSIIEYLKWKKVFYWRQKNTGFKLNDRWIPSGTVGLPDIFVIKQARCLGCETDCGCKAKPFGQIYGLEVKANKNKQSSAQLEWEQKFINAGGIYKIIRSIDDITKII